MKHTTYHHKNLRNELIEKGIELVEEYGMQQYKIGDTGLPPVQKDY